jgi:hypothetical protein
MFKQKPHSYVIVKGVARSSNYVRGFLPSLFVMLVIACLATTLSLDQDAGSLPRKENIAIII